MTTLSGSSVRKILAAIDDSVRGPFVFRTAATLAKELTAELFLVRVLSVPPEIPAAAHSHPDHLEEKLGKDARDELHALMAETPDVVFGPPIVVQGDPWRHILDVARDIDVDLILVGSHRYNALGRALGTVAAKVVNNADRNVLVVHARKSESIGR